MLRIGSREGWSPMRRPGCGTWLLRRGGSRRLMWGRGGVSFGVFVLGGWMYDEWEGGEVERGKGGHTR